MTAMATAFREKIPPPTKADVFITRRCNLSCRYCKIVRNQVELTPEEWSLVPRVLKEIGVKFIAAWGAEPLVAIDSLEAFIRGVRKCNLPMTIDTNAVLLPKYIDRLVEAGLDSITFGYDIVSDDWSIMKKKSSADDILEQCKEKFRDVEFVVTLTPKNITLLPEFIRKCTEENMWVMFDFYHPDRGQEGTRCTTVPEYMFKREDIETVRNVMKEVLQLKRSGYLLHPTEEIIEFIVNEPYAPLTYSWKCKGMGVVTVDSNGYIFGCHDFQPRSFRMRYHIFDYGASWEWKDFVKNWRNELVKCPGCFWIARIMDEGWVGKKGWEQYICHRDTKCKAKIELT
jgi:MoaA/NifB/PqqE/SkfB family radical SAM enzyme